MLCKESLGKVYQIYDWLVLCISPPRCELKAVACFFTMLGSSIDVFFDVCFSCRVAVILGISAVRDNEYLDILIQSCSSPKAITLIAIDLVEGFLNINTSTL